MGRMLDSMKELRRTMPTPTVPANLLLRSMAADDYALLEPFLRRGRIRAGDVIAAAGEKIEEVCFPEGGVASYAEVSDTGQRTGIGIAGHEGMIQWHAMLGCDHSPYEITIAVGEGTVLRIETARLLEACRSSVTLHRHLTRFVQAFLIQLGATAVSNLVDPVERRLCRWLLMNHDRIAGDEISLTHGQVGEMLGIRRASVTDAMHVLEGQGIVRAERRLIAIRDRPRLRHCAGENYGRAEAEYSRLIAPFGKG
jgi:CRP-like cAMP-binding protein